MSSWDESVARSVRSVLLVVLDFLGTAGASMGASLSLSGSWREVAALPNWWSVNDGLRL